MKADNSIMSIPHHHAVAIVFALLASMPLPAACRQTADAQRPVASIREAQWEAYKDMYPQSPVCTTEEVTLWLCEKGHKAYALCTTPRVTTDAGYIQYRAAENGKIEFAYPSVKVPPAGLFAYDSSANGDAAVDFSNGGYRYTLVDPLRDASSILVQTEGKPGRVTRIDCDSANQTLQINYTMRLMYEGGVWSAYPPASP